MNNQKKRILIEITAIIIVAIFFALINNFISDKPLPLIKTQPKIESVNDSVLFGKTPKNQIHLEMTVTYEQILKLLKKPDVQFIDARSPEQYAKGYIGNAINIFPLIDDQQKLYETIYNLPTNKIYILYCDGGTCDLSHQLIQLFYQFGYNQSFLYKGGWEEWTKKQGLTK